EGLQVQRRLARVVGVTLGLRAFAAPVVGTVDLGDRVVGDARRDPDEPAVAAAEHAVRRRLEHQARARARADLAARDLDESLVRASRSRHACRRLGLGARTPMTAAGTQPKY